MRLILYIIICCIGSLQAQESVASSKKQMIENIDRNFSNIQLLKSEYLKLVPKGYRVTIEFKPANIAIGTKESIDITIYYDKEKNDKPDVEERNLQRNFAVLDMALLKLHWTNETLDTIQALLKKANCISIENSPGTLIGFARSGMGKYSFVLIDYNLTPEEIADYNEYCMFAVYKDNIVLEYEGPAESPCFPEE
jgi:hypothetical protein